jgi:hypothetical protein
MIRFYYCPVLGLKWFEIKEELPTSWNTQPSKKRRKRRA